RDDLVTGVQTCALPILPVATCLPNALIYYIYLESSPSRSPAAAWADETLTYVSSIELGKVSVGIEIANQLALALGRRLSDLVKEIGRASCREWGEVTGV